ncbi:MAG: hypothetical protein ACRENB_00735 [Gemmatimonadales bacterium]
MRTNLFGAALSAGVLMVAATSTWNAQLEPKGGSGIRGMARVETGGPGPMMRDTPVRDTTPKDPRDTTAYDPARSAVADGGGATASVSIEGAKSGKSLAWHVHQGKCSDTPGPIVGAETAYQSITVDDRGKGSSNASIRASLREGMDYSVSVHGGPSKTDAVVSCGDLRSDAPRVPPARSR